MNCDHTCKQLTPGSHYYHLQMDSCCHTHTSHHCQPKPARNQRDFPSSFAVDCFACSERLLCIMSVEAGTLAQLAQRDMPQSGRRHDANAWSQVKPSNGTALPTVQSKTEHVGHKQGKAEQIKQSTRAAPGQHQGNAILNRTEEANKSLCCH